MGGEAIILAQKEAGNLFKNCLQSMDSWQCVEASDSKGVGNLKSEPIFQNNFATISAERGLKSVSYYLMIATESMLIIAIGAYFAGDLCFPNRPTQRTLTQASASAFIVSGLF